MRLLKTLIFACVFIFCANPSFAKGISKLYFLENTEISITADIIDFYLNGRNEKVSKDGYKYLVSDGTNPQEKYHIITLNDFDKGIYLYYAAGSEEDAFDNILKKRFKARNISFKSVRKESLMKEYKALADEFKEQQSAEKKTVYDFSDAAQAEFDAKRNAVLPVNKEVLRPIAFQPLKESSFASVPKSHFESKLLKGHIVQIPEGVSFNARLQSTINSESTETNDTIAATLSDDWVYNGAMIAPEGSVIYGVAVDAQNAGNAYKNGQLGITFNEILTPAGQKINLTSNIVMLKVDTNRAMKITGNILCGALMGVAAGALYTVASGGNVAAGLATGAAAGAAGGTLFAVSAQGQNVEIPEGTNLNIRLTKSMSAEIYY